jgi:hypothetical protein
MPETTGRRENTVRVKKYCFQAGRRVSIAHLDHPLGLFSYTEGGILAVTYKLPFMLYSLKTPLLLVPAIRLRRCVIETRATLGVEFPIQRSAQVQVSLTEGMRQ